MKQLPHLLACFVTTCLLAPLWAEEPCPDVRSSQIDARVEVSDTGKKCGIGIRILGLGGSIGGEFCPSYKFVYPSHQECKGDASPGNRCQPAGQLAVTALRCDCAIFGGFGTGIVLPNCECAEDPAAGGHVEDARTVSCRTPR